MRIQDMVYNFELKGDNVSSRNVTNLPIPAKIYLLNEGQLSLVKKRYSGPNTNLRASFEEIQKRRDEFQKILVTNENLEAKKLDKSTYVSDITKTKHEYMFLARTNAIATKNGCERRLRGILSQTDDLDIIEESPLQRSSFEWGEMIFRMTNDNLEFITDSTFEVTKSIIDYLRYPGEMSIQGYETFEGIASEDKDCELPRFMHYDVVDEAILVYSTAMTQEMQAKILKMQNDE